MVFKAVGPNHLRYWCPGCNCNHIVDLARWTWDGFGSLSPSILVHSSEGLTDDPPDDCKDLTKWCDEHRFTTPRCHHFVKDGKIEFLSDCDHSLAGQTVPMRELSP